MRKVSIFKKLSLFFLYKKVLKGLRRDLELQFNARIDNVNRIYTVLNIPSDLVEEPYNLRKNDIDTIARNYIKEYTSNLSSFLNSRGLAELYVIYDLEKVDKYSYLIIVGFSLFNTQKVSRSLLLVWTPILFALSLSTLLYFILSS